MEYSLDGEDIHVVLVELLVKLVCPYRLEVVEGGCVLRRFVKGALNGALGGTQATLVELDVESRFGG